MNEPHAQSCQPILDKPDFPMLLSQKLKRIRARRIGQVVDIIPEMYDITVKPAKKKR